MPETKNLPPTKRAFTFCTKTREYLGELDVYLSPIEGTYPLPSNAVLVEPGPEPGPLKARRLLPDGSAWEVVDDFRYIMLRDTSTARPVPNTLALGDQPPAGITHLTQPIYSPQDCRCAVWDGQLNVWIAAPDYSRTALWVKATAQRASSLPPGTALPATLTTVPPPTGEYLHVAWNETTRGWEVVPPDIGPMSEEALEHES
jgi:hypothetical protein